MWKKINRVKRYNALYQQSRHSKWEKRILAELGYLLELSKVQGGKYDELLLAQIDRLYEEFEERGSISNQTALAAEQALLGLQAEAKKYKITCAAHAHIDMNWMWGFQETVTVTVDTFRTMLALMEEYPDFTFSQSQASVYHIIEEYYPELLEKIKHNRLAGIVGRAGLTSMIFGFLFGSVFGVETLLNPVHQSLFGVREKLFEVMDAKAVPEPAVWGARGFIDAGF